MKKTTPSNLSQKLTQYGALALAITSMVDSNGQIVYKDVNPDVGGPNVDYYLDLNNDGITDFLIHNFYDTLSFGDYLVLIPMAGNSALGFQAATFSYSNYSYYAHALNSGDIISAGKSSWQNYRYQYLNYYSCIGDNSYEWCGVTDKYLGLRFHVDGNTYYGWARLDVALNQNDWVIKDYAYNSSLAGSGRGPQAEGAPIMAGEGRPLGFEDNAFPNIKIIASNQRITLSNLPEKTNYRLYALTGQSVLEGKTKNSTYVIEANTLSSGVYIIELENDSTKAILRKKIIL